MSRGELKKLSSLFDKYKERLIAPERTVIDSFVEVVNDLMGIPLDKKKVKYTPSTKTVYFVGSGAIRNELKLQEKEILVHVAGRIGEKNAPKRIV